VGADQLPGGVQAAHQQAVRITLRGQLHAQVHQQRQAPVADLQRLGVAGQRV